MAKGDLKGVRVAVLAADGFEQVEVTRPVKALERAGADVRVLSIRPGRLRGMNFIWPGRKISVDDTLAHAEPSDYSALLLPGGFVNPDLLRQNLHAREFVQRFEALGRPIAVICHGPALLISAGLVKNRRVASWPGIADDVRNAGGTWVDAPVVRDQNWVSSRSPLDLPAFNEAMLGLFAERAPLMVNKVPRRMQWAPILSRVFTLALISLAIVGGRAGLRALSRR